MAATLLLLALAASSAAQSPKTYVPEDGPYVYQGCYNETTTLSDSNTRALSGGVSQLGFGNMTVPLCLEYCAGGTDTEYKYAGLQYSRECWCAQRLSGLSEEVDEGDCDLACDGDKGMACGGDLKLSLYMVESGAAARTVGWGVAVGSLVVAAVML